MKDYDVGHDMGCKNLNSEIRVERIELKRNVILSQRQGSEGYEPPHALKRSYRGLMISDFQVQHL